MEISPERILAFLDDVQAACVGDKIVKIKLISYAFQMSVKTISGMLCN